METVVDENLLERAVDELIESDDLKNTDFSNNVGRRIHPQVEYLINLPKVEQKSAEWYAMRENMITASDIGSITGDNPYTSRKQLMTRKTNREEFKGNFATQWGNKYEDIICITYSKRTKSKVIEFGLIGHPHYSFLGASPDGISEDGIMLEIKCPPRREIVHGEIPRYYWVQMQIQMEVCDLEQCDFCQCKIVEIPESEWLKEMEDLNGQENVHCGMILETPDENGIMRYIYPPTVFNTVNEWNEWRDNHKYLLETHWKIETYSCVRVNRDRDWFKEKISVIKEFWDELSSNRTNGVIIEKKKRAKKETENIMKWFGNDDAENNSEVSSIQEDEISRIMKEIHKEKTEMIGKISQESKPEIEIECQQECIVKDVVVLDKIEVIEFSDDDVKFKERLVAKKQKQELLKKKRQESMKEKFRKRYLEENAAINDLLYGECAFRDE